VKKPTTRGGPSTILASLQADLEKLAVEAAANPPSSHQRRQLDRALRALSGRIEKLLRDLDPIQQPTSVFDPSNPKIIGRFTALALVAQARHLLAEVASFYGSGVYAIYYKGSFEPYAPISGTETPIYVGQASPETPNARTPIEQGAKLSSRLNEHRRNIEKASSTLRIDDFECRMLVVQSGWETAAEDYLIRLFRPIWNKETKILYGLGKHGDSAETRTNKRSPWDTLHPARVWAAPTVEDARSPGEIHEDLRQHFVGARVFANMSEVLGEFLDGLRQA
jgi:Eco29kI restriction endonuclease